MKIGKGFVRLIGCREMGEQSIESNSRKAGELFDFLRGTLPPISDAPHTGVDLDVNADAVPRFGAIIRQCLGKLIGVNRRFDIPFNNLRNGFYRRIAEQHNIRTVDASLTKRDSLIEKSDSQHIHFFILKHFRYVHTVPVSVGFHHADNFNAGTHTFFDGGVIVIKSV